MRVGFLLFYGFLFLGFSACSGSFGESGSQNQPDKISTDSSDSQSHCGSTSLQEGDLSIPSQPNKVRFNSGVNAEEKCALNEAISLLYTLPLESQNPTAAEMQQMMKVPSVDPAQLQSWLEDRVQFAIESDFDLDTHMVKIDSAFHYPEPNKIPDAFETEEKKSSQQTQSDENKDVIMLNMGSFYYGEGKVNKELLGVDLGNLGLVPLVSPRVGLLKIGPGMFPDVGSKKIQNAFFDIFRAATLFHEARHSDGHGKSMGFLHEKCPVGHTYGGRYACDAATNGAYSIGALMQKNLMNSCKDCSKSTMAALRLLYLDISDRVLSPEDATDPGVNGSSEAAFGKDWDDAPEGHR